MTEMPKQIKTQLYIKQMGHIRSMDMQENLPKEVQDSLDLVF